MKKKSNNKIIILAVLLVMILSVTVPVQAQELAKKRHASPTPMPESSGSEYTAAELIKYAKALADLTVKSKKTSEENVKFLQSEYEVASNGNYDAETIDSSVSEYKKTLETNKNRLYNMINVYSELSDASDQVDFTSSESKKFWNNMKTAKSNMAKIWSNLDKQKEIINNMKDTVAE